MSHQSPEYARSYYELVTKPKRKAVHRASRAVLGHDAITLSLRLPAALHARLAAAAADNGRSLNAEMLARLEGG